MIRKLRLWNPETPTRANPRRRTRFPAYAYRANPSTSSVKPNAARRKRRPAAQSSELPRQLSNGRWFYRGAFISEGKARQILKMKRARGGKSTTRPRPAARRAAPKKRATKASKPRRAKSTPKKKPSARKSTRKTVAKKRRRRPWNKGKKLSASHKRKISRGLKRKPAVKRRRRKATTTRRRRVVRAAAPRRRRATARRAAPKRRVVRRRRRTTTVTIRTNPKRRARGRLSKQRIYLRDTPRARRRTYRIRRTTRTGARRGKYYSYAVVRKNDLMATLKNALMGALPALGGLLASRVGSALLRQKLLPSLSQNARLVQYGPILAPAAVLAISALVAPKISNKAVADGLMIGGALGLLDSIVRTFVGPQIKAASSNEFAQIIGGALSGYVGDSGLSLPHSNVGAISGWQVQQALAEYVPGMGVDVTEALAGPGGSLTGNSLIA